MFKRREYAKGYVIGGNRSYSAFDKGGALLGHTELLRDAVALTAGPRSRQAQIRMGLLAEVAVSPFDQQRINWMTDVELEAWADLLGIA